MTDDTPSITAQSLGDVLTVAIETREGDRSSFAESMRSMVAIQLGKALMATSDFEAIPGMAYLLLQGSRIQGRGRIEKVDPEWGPIDNGAPIDAGWIPDLTDQDTFDLLMRFSVITEKAEIIKG